MNRGSARVDGRWCLGAVELAGAEDCGGDGPSDGVGGKCITKPGSPGSGLAFGGSTSLSICSRNRVGVSLYVRGPCLRVVYCQG